MKSSPINTVNSLSVQNLAPSQVQCVRIMEAYFHQASLYQTHYATFRKKNPLLRNHDNERHISTIYIQWFMHLQLSLAMWGAWNESRKTEMEERFFSFQRKFATTHPFVALRGVDIVGTAQHNENIKQAQWGEPLTQETQEITRQYESLLAGKIELSPEEKREAQKLYHEGLRLITRWSQTQKRDQKSDESAVQVIDMLRVFGAQFLLMELRDSLNMTPRPEDIPTKEEAPQSPKLDIPTQKIKAWLEENPFYQLWEDIESVNVRLPESTQARTNIVREQVSTIIDHAATQEDMTLDADQFMSLIGSTLSLAEDGKKSKKELITLLNTLLGSKPKDQTAKDLKAFLFYLIKQNNTAWILQS